MRILQLVDSLEAGGTERMAVNLANALASHEEHSALCTTRAEGPLKVELLPEVAYLFLNKSSTMDFGAWKRLYQFLKAQRIDLLHAHSSSYGLAVIMKWLLPQLKVVWHDHCGQSEFLDRRTLQPLKILSRSFSGSIAVNAKLSTWHSEQLNLSEVLLLSNFVSSKVEFFGETFLKGNPGKRIICLANWRTQKDLFNLLKAFEQLYQQHPEWSLHLVGKQFQDAYEEQIRAEISRMKAGKAVYVYGSVKDVGHVLSQASIGVLSSRSEGLPLSLLEYGQAGLPVVVTNVGDCAVVVQDQVHGMLVKPEDPYKLAEALQALIADQTKAQQLGLALQTRVVQHFSAAARLNILTEFYREL